MDRGRRGRVAARRHAPWRRRATADADSDQGNRRGDHAPDRKRPRKSNHQSAHRCKSVTVDSNPDHCFGLILGAQRRSRWSLEQQALDLLIIKDRPVFRIESFEYTGHRLVLKGAKSIFRAEHDRLAPIVLAAMQPYSVRRQSHAASLAETVTPASLFGALAVFRERGARRLCFWRAEAPPRRRSPGARPGVGSWWLRSVRSTRTGGEPPDGRGAPGGPIQISARRDISPGSNSVRAMNAGQLSRCVRRAKPHCKRDCT